jgi:hypothetical protein
MLPACPSDSATSSLTLTICLLSPGSGRWGWKVLSERVNEIVIGTGQNAPAGMCFMPVTNPKTVENRVHLDPTSSAADRDQGPAAFLRSGLAGPASARPALNPGLSWPTRRKRVLRRGPEGNAYPMRLSTANRRQTLSHWRSVEGRVASVISGAGARIS